MHHQTANDASYLANVAATAGRNEDAVEYLISITQTGELGSDDQSLFATLAQSVVSALRCECDELDHEQVSQITLGDHHRAELAKRAQAAVEIKLRSLCNEVMHLLKAHLLPRASQIEDEVFWNKMYADYARYLSECTYDDAAHTSLIHTSRVHYRKASAIAEASLSPCHPLRLGVALNRAVLYVALGDRVRGVEITKAAFDTAFEAVLQKVESGVKRETLEDTVAGMDMLSDNYRLWTGEAIELQPFEPMSRDEYLAKEAKADNSISLGRRLRCTSF